MDRRTFIGFVGGALLAVPLDTHAQQVGKVYRIGILEAIPAAQNAASLSALRNGLRDLGYVEDQNLLIEYRYGEGKLDRMPGLRQEHSD